MELRKGRPQVLPPAVVLPAETTALPDIGPALAAGRFGGTLFERVPLALRVGGGRRLLADQIAEIAEMRLRRGTLGQVGRPPSGNEIGSEHGSR